jgi:NADH:ubiquinone oxidoreductase subunit C
MTESLELSFVKEVMNGLGDAEHFGTNRIKVATIPGRIKKAILLAQTLLACDHLIQISAVDNGDTFELIYNMTGSHRTVLSLTIELPRDRPEAPTTSDILPAAGIYERQIHDLLGIEFKGHPGLKRIILNEDWPADEYPLRKDWKPKPGISYGGICQEEK